MLAASLTTARRVIVLVALVVTARRAICRRCRRRLRARPMTFLDMQQMRQVGSPTPSPDRRLLLYTLSTPTGKRPSGKRTSTWCRCKPASASTRQLTFTKEKNETSPRWARDGSVFFFLSNREAPESAATRNQLYVMRPDGGEVAPAHRYAKEGVSDYAISRDGRWLVYRSGKSGEEQLYRLPLPLRIETAQSRNRSPSTRPACGRGNGRPTAGASIS